MKWEPVKTPLGSAFDVFTFFLLFVFYGYKYGEFRADCLAELAVAAGILVLDIGRMVTLDVELVRQLKDVPRTIFDAKRTSLTTVFFDVDFALDLFNISEVLHINLT
jgi:hypothetical protein